MPEMMEALLKEYKTAITAVLEQHEILVVLYGSYARGDFHSDSDIDVMILADIALEEVGWYRDKIYDITYDFETKYGVEINPIIQSRKIYEQWKKIYPFFSNIDKEGFIV